MKIAETMRQKLTDAFDPTHLDVIDDSASHAGHAGANPLGESHFNVAIVSAAFDGKSRVERQRMVYGVLAAELADRVHALSLKTSTPEESSRGIS